MGMEDLYSSESDVYKFVFGADSNQLLRYRIEWEPRIGGDEMKPLPDTYPQIQGRREINSPRMVGLWWCLIAFFSLAGVDKTIDARPLRASGFEVLAQAAVGESQTRAKDELQIGTFLTRDGKLSEAIPHLLAARAAGADPYASTMNLAICYVGSGQYHDAISGLEGLRASGYNTASMQNLLAQAYLGDLQQDRAWNAFLVASELTPNDEKLYAFMADACTDQRDFDMGLRAVDVGLHYLPESARLRYERGLFLARLGRLADAKPEWDHAAQLAPDTYIAILALVQGDLYDGNIPVAAHRMAESVAAGHHDYQTLSLLGTVLMHAGAAPGDPEFARAQEALEQSAKTNPEYSPTQIALGEMYILQDRFREAVEHLEIGRRLEPRNPAVYSNLMRAYHHLGDRQKELEMQEQLGTLLNRQKFAAPETSAQQ
jgi:tetratricopeptide (TPR) repeat protein